MLAYLHGGANGTFSVVVGLFTSLFWLVSNEPLGFGKWESAFVKVADSNECWV